MSKGSDTRFKKGHSGNPHGRPKRRRPHISAFDIVFDKTLTVTQNGVERELTVDEGLQLQTYQAALKGSRMAIRQVLKMIEKGEVALAELDPPKRRGSTIEVEHQSDNANEAMLLLGIADFDEPPEGCGPGARPFKLTTWATQAALSLPGRRKVDDKDIENLKRHTIAPNKLKWPRRRAA